jgi:hypothetical protein
MLIELATTSFRTLPRSFARRSRSVAVPPTFVDVYRSISYCDWPTPTFAAK